MANGFNPTGVWGPKGRAFSQGVVQHEGRVIHVTGQVAWDADHRIVGEGDVGAQLRKCFENVEAILAEVGGVLDDIVSQTIYYTDDAQLPQIQEVRSRHFSVPTAPVSILIRAAGLVDPGLLVEVVPVAVVPHERFREP
jgi:enamine deaminase RidA (YjgF/YER057c/UK114 family)